MAQTFFIALSKVQDYARWRANFDEDSANRSGNGFGAARVFRSRENPNELTILIEVNDLEKAKRYSTSDELKEKMQRGGVIPPPNFNWINEEQ